MSKQWSGERLQHLYLVLDDWSEGYSIRRINLSAEDIRPPLIPADAAQGDAIFTGRYTLPSALFRFEGRRGEPKSIVGAFGNKILASLPLTHGRSHANEIHVFDIRTRSFILRSWPSQDVFNFNHICIPIGGTLFVLSNDSFDMLNLPLVYDYANRNCAWSCFKLPEPTFPSNLITSYAVHPHEQTIFVSSVDQSGVFATFSFSVDSMMWRQHGPWQLPFNGCGYFVPNLGVWVGLSGERNTIGHICSCAVVSSLASHNERPVLKLSKEKLFSEVSGERHIGATLIYMGGENKFCLLEGICVEADWADQQKADWADQLTEFGERNDDYVDDLNETDSDEMSVESFDEVNEKLDPKRFLRLTTFSLCYDKNGELTVGNSRRVWYYNVSTEVTEAALKCPMAFWM